MIIGIILLPQAVPEKGISLLNFSYTQSISLDDSGWKVDCDELLGA